MKLFNAALIIVSAALTACAAAVVLKASDGVTYFCGETASFTPDGRLPYGKTEAAVKRELLAGGARIVETVTLPAPGHGMRPKTVVTELKRRGKKLVYDAADQKGTFSGTVTFKDAELKSWTYDLKFRDGGAVKGTGALTAEGLKTEKSVTAGRPMLVRDDLKAVSQEEYQAMVNSFQPARGME